MTLRTQLLTAAVATALLSGAAIAQSRVSITSDGISFGIEGSGNTLVDVSDGEGRLGLGDVTVTIDADGVSVGDAVVSQRPDESILLEDHADGIRVVVDGLMVWQEGAGTGGDAGRERLVRAEDARAEGDPERARELAAEAIELGDIDAPAFLGELYFNGEGGSRNLLRARMLFRQAVDLGDSDGQLFMGFMHHLGEGAPLDYAEAARWYREAAERDNEAAIRNLPILAADSEFEAVSYDEALRWLEVLESLENPDAEAIRTKVEEARGGPAETAPEEPTGDSTPATVEEDSGETTGRRGVRRGDSSKR